MKFKDYLNEAKQVGNIYHFTTLDSLNKLLDDNFQSKYNLEILEFIARNDKFSCTRNACLAQDIFSKDISIKKGYIVRIAIDGNKISNKYKIKPQNGLDDNSSEKTNLNNTIGKKYHEFEEQLISKSKTFKLKDYIKQIDIQNSGKSDKNFNKIILQLEKNKINYDLVRLFTVLKESEIPFINCAQNGYELKLINL